VRLSRPQVVAAVHAIPELRFEDQRLTSFSGLVIFQALFQRLRLKERLAAAMTDARAAAYRPQNLVMMLVVHLLLGFRRLREVSVRENAAEIAPDLAPVTLTATRASRGCEINDLVKPQANGPRTRPARRWSAGSGAATRSRRSREPTGLARRACTGGGGDCGARRRPLNRDRRSGSRLSRSFRQP
jgi:hypothetical protein